MFIFTWCVEAIWTSLLDSITGSLRVKGDFYIITFFAVVTLRASRYHGITCKLGQRVIILKHLLTQGIIFCHTLYKVIGVTECIIMPPPHSSGIVTLAAEKVEKSCCCSFNVRFCFKITVLYLKTAY